MDLFAAYVRHLHRFQSDAYVRELTKHYIAQRAKEVHPTDVSLDTLDEITDGVLQGKCSLDDAINHLIDLSIT